MSISNILPSNNQPMALFEQALQQYQKHVILPASKSDQRLFQRATLKDALDEIKRAEEKCLKESQTRKVIGRIQHFFQILDRYGNIIDTAIQFDPTPSSLVWGGLKLVCKVAGDYAAYFTALVQMIDDIANHFPRLEDYEKLFPEDRLRNVILSAYSHILSFLAMANRTFSTCGFKILIKSLWKPLHREVEKSKAALAGIMQLADAEVHAISASYAHEERISQHDERKQSSLERSAQGGERAAQAKERALQMAERTSQNEERFRAEEARDEERRRNAEQQRQAAEQLRYEVMSWLARAEAPDVYMNALSKHAEAPESCSWIYKETEYRQWMQDCQKVNALWIHSGPGTGKTILASHIIRTLKEQTAQADHIRAPSAVSYFFCNSLSNTADDSQATIRSLLCELLYNLPDLPEELIYLYKQTRKKGIEKANALVPSTLHSLVFATLKRFKATYIILDGLDECEHRFDILQFLRELYQADEMANVHLLVTSRDEPDIRKALQLFREFKIRPSDTKLDLHGYVRNAVQTIPNLDEDRRASTIKILSKKASGLFIWIRLVIDLLKDAATPSEFDEILHTIPRGLHQVYCVVIERLNNRLSVAPMSRRRMANDLFRWLSLAPRPLHLDELREATAMAAVYRSQPQERHHALQNFEKYRPSTQAILDICCTIVDYDEVAGTVRLLHHTAREFLTNTHDEWERSTIVQQYTKIYFVDTVLKIICSHLKFAMRFSVIAIVSLLQVVTSHTDLGINCNGSTLCALCAPHILPDLNTAVQAQPDDEIFVNGEHIACESHFCVFLQNEQGAKTGAEVKLKMEEFVAHGCTCCGSCPTEPGNNVTAGQLVVDFVLNPNYINSL
ncbi:hypothetical protein F5Y16DRAFT_402432 [Xylariaceae sp. FL0255]|nr:hypothetical protein F5Y16DRAFT_402432 [Xylariaceae sp. FL0255]